MEAPQTQTNTSRKFVTRVANAFGRIKGLQIGASLRRPGKDQLRPESQFTKENSQWLRRLTKHCWPTDHLASPHVTNKPSCVADCTSDEIARRGAPRASYHPGEGDEGKGKIRCCDGEQTEERDGR